MLIGTTTYPDPNDALPLTFAIEFYQDGEYGGLNSVTDCEGNEYGLEQATGIFYALPAAVRGQIESECWADAEPECDDAACDDARAP